MDSRIFTFFNSLSGHGKNLDLIIVFFAEYLAYIILAAFFAYLFFSAYSRKEKLVMAISAFFAAGISRYGFTSLLRFLWHRPRPFVALHLKPLFSEASYSFPSAHAAFFFAFSTLIFFYNKRLGAIFFIASLFMSAGRIAAGVHYPSDIFGGMILGILSGWLTWKWGVPRLRRFAEGKNAKPL